MKKKNEILKNNKERLCQEIVSKNVKKVTTLLIVSTGEKFNLTKEQSLKAWKNFQETGGRVDLRYRKNSKKVTFIANPTHKGNRKKREVTPAEASKILLEYMQERNITSRELSNKYNISLDQFYDWIRELNVSGTILGRKVLDPKKYAKLNVLDAIWLKKRPTTKRQTIRDLSALEKSALERVGDVLITYLQDIK